MDNSAGQAHRHAPFPNSSPQPEGQSGHPNAPNVTLPSSSVSSASTPQQSYQPTSIMHPPPSTMYGFTPAHQYANYGMSANNHWPNHGGYGVRVPQAHGVNGTARPQMYPYPVNSNSFPPNVQTNTTAGTHPALHGHAPSFFQPQPAQVTSQTTPPFANIPPVVRSSSQNLGRGGPPLFQGYRKIINENLLPQNSRSIPYQTSNPYPQAPNQVFNGGYAPLYPPPGRADAPRQITSGGQVPQPQHQTKYNLPQRAPMPPPNDGTASRPAAFDDSAAQGGNVHHDAIVPVPSTTLPATNTNGKRTADVPLPQQPEKRQKSAANNSTKQHPQPVAKASQVIPVQDIPTPPQDDDYDFQRDIQMLKEANDLFPSPEPTTVTQNTEPKQPLPALKAEPEHLPEAELVKISTSMVIEPDASKPPPKGRKIMTWAEAVKEIMKILDKAEFGRILRPRAQLEELTDTVEKFIARPGRRRLLVRELEELVAVRYARVTEDYIALCYLDLYHLRDYDTATPQKKQEVVRKAWERREKERYETGPGPNFEEVQKEVSKWF